MKANGGDKSGVVEEESLWEEDTMLEQMRGDMTSLMLNATTVIKLAIMLWNAIIILMVLKKKLILLTKNKVKSQSYYWHSKLMKKMTGFMVLG